MSTLQIVDRYLAGQLSLGDLNMQLDENEMNGADDAYGVAARHLIAEATSGSDIKAADLIAESSHVKATSGADITVNTSKELIAKASSGGDVEYYGNPEKVEKSDNPSGSVKQK